MTGLFLLPWAAATILASPADDSRIVTQPELREMAAFDLRSGFVRASPIKVWVVQGKYLRWSPGSAAYPAFGSTPKPSEDALLKILRRQCQVEAIRNDRGTSSERAIGDPTLARVEAVIARALEGLDRGGLDEGESWSQYNREIDEIYQETLAEYASRVGIRYIPLSPTVPPGTTPPALRELASACVNSELFNALPPTFNPVGQKYLSYESATVRVASPTRVLANGEPIDYSIPWALRRQCEVEVTRRDRGSAEDLAFWGPVLARVEAVIARWPEAHDNNGMPDDQALDRLNREVEAIYKEAVGEYATRLGRTLVIPTPYAPGMIPPPSIKFVDVTLTTPDGQGVILLARWLDWRIATLSGGGSASDQVFEKIAPGTVKSMLGTYAYKIMDKAGKASGVNRAEITRPETRLLLP